MKAQILRKLAVNPQRDILDSFEIRQGEVPALGVDGVFVGASAVDVLPKRTGFLTTFPLLPATTQAAANEKFLITSGTGTEVASVATKGGVLMTSGGSSADQAMLIGVTATASRVALSATNLVRFAAKVSLAAITSLFGSFGLNENVTDPDPTGTAGDGAAFLFDPDATITTGLTAGQHANWILAHKVNGADTFTATTIPVEAGRDYILEVKIGTDLIASYYIDGVLVGVSPALTSGDSVSAFLGVEATTAATKSFEARAVSMSRELA